MQPTANLSSAYLDSDSNRAEKSCVEGVTGGLQCQDGKQYNQIRLSMLLYPYYRVVNDHGDYVPLAEMELAEMELTKGFEPPTL
jgi:hypothetical protein